MDSKPRELLEKIASTCVEHEGRFSIEVTCEGRRDSRINLCYIEPVCPNDIPVCKYHGGILRNFGQFNINFGLLRQYFWLCNYERRER